MILMAVMEPLWRTLLERTTNKRFQRWLQSYVLDVCMRSKESVRRRLSFRLLTDFYAFRSLFFLQRSPLFLVCEMQEEIVGTSLSFSFTGGLFYVPISFVYPCFLQTAAREADQIFGPRLRKDCHQPRHRFGRDHFHRTFATQRERSRPSPDQGF